MNNTQTATTLSSSAPRLSTKEIADLLGLSREHVTDRITKRADFPKPFINISRRTRYWRTSDVLQWMQGKNNSTKR